MEKIVKYGLFGAFATAATPYILQGLNKLFSFVPSNVATVNVQSVVNLQVTGVGGVINTGVAAKLLGLIPNVPYISNIPVLVTTMIGGALALMIGGGLVTMTKGGVLGNFFGLKNKFAEIMESLTWASLIVGMILAGSLSMSPWQSILALVVDSAILTVLYVYVVFPILEMVKLDKYMP